MLFLALTIQLGSKAINKRIVVWMRGFRRCDGNPPAGASLRAGVKVGRIRRSRHPAQRRERSLVQLARRRCACAGLRCWITV
ncbi:hypothetical protein KP13_32178 [Klebsiella pneumoniae subsp. pneumoniae Kp13]|nr:hypothetical protein KP13_32178 [Klebsiella pneumoniae subsp. pneumoniae Kp13]